MKIEMERQDWQALADFINAANDAKTEIEAAIADGKQQVSVKKKAIESKMANLHDYHWRANFIRAVDGDTFDVVIDRGFDDYSQKRIRLAHVDTPELRSRDEAERAQAQKARDYAAATMAGATEGFKLKVQSLVTRKGDERRTFGRYVAVITLPNGEDLATKIVDAKLGVWSNRT
jgi:endonuclease YncB( thermonuclease family)